MRRYRSVVGINSLYLFPVPTESLSVWSEFPSVVYLSSLAKESIHLVNVPGLLYLPPPLTLCGGLILQKGERVSGIEISSIEI